MNVWQVLQGCVQQAKGCGLGCQPPDLQTTTAGKTATAAVQSAAGSRPGTATEQLLRSPTSKPSSPLASQLSTGKNRLSSPLRCSVPAAPATAPAGIGAGTGGAMPGIAAVAAVAAERSAAAAAVESQLLNERTDPKAVAQGDSSSADNPLSVTLCVAAAANVQLLISYVSGATPHPGQAVQAVTGREHEIMHSETQQAGQSQHTHYTPTTGAQAHARSKHEATAASIGLRDLGQHWHTALPSRGQHVTAQHVASTRPPLWAAGVLYAQNSWSVP